MTNAPLRAEHAHVDAVISENVNTLIHRSRETAAELARTLGMSKATLSRKMIGVGGWYYVEVEAIAAHYDVTPAELAGVLPNLTEWNERRACRESNPKPSVLVLPVTRRLTLELLAGGRRAGVPSPSSAALLRAVS